MHRSCLRRRNGKLPSSQRILRRFYVIMGYNSVTLFLPLSIRCSQIDLITHQSIDRSLPISINPFIHQFVCNLPMLNISHATSTALELATYRRRSPKLSSCGCCVATVKFQRWEAITCLDTHPLLLLLGI